jgi:hypothetical protein
VARDLIGVPMFSAARTYAIGAAANYQNKLYVAQVAVSAGAFNPAQWSQITGQVVATPYPQVSNQSGLTGRVTGATTINFTVVEVALRDNTGKTILFTPSGIIGNNLNTIGLGGIDLGGGIPASSWVHYYWISDGTNLSTIASLTAPPTGPTMPSGYTYRAYIGAFRWTSSNALYSAFLRGQRVFTDGPSIALSSGTASSPTNVNVASLIPPNCSSYEIVVNMYGPADIIVQAFGDIYLVGTTTFMRTTIFNDGAHGSVSEKSVEIPNNNQIFAYGVSAAGASITMSVHVQSYAMPNGAS